MARESSVAVPEGFEDLLERPLIAHFATTRPDGSVQVNPMWFGWDGRQIRLTHTKVRQKFKNVEHEPRVALSIVDPSDPQRYLELRGTVESVEADPGAAFYQTLRERYSSTGSPIRDADVRVVMTIRPTAILGRRGTSAGRPPEIIRGRRA